MPKLPERPAQGRPFGRRDADEAASVRNEAREGAEHASATFAALKIRFALPDIDDFTGFLARIDERARLRSDLADRRSELARASEQIPELDLRAGLADLTVDSIEWTLSQLASEAEHLHEDGNIAYAQRERLQARRTLIEGGHGAEVATAHKSAAEIAIRETAHRYIVLKLGSLLLSAAIERHRAGQQDPLVARAGVLFSSRRHSRFPRALTPIQQVATAPHRKTECTLKAVHLKPLSCDALMGETDA